MIAMLAKPPTKSIFYYYQYAEKSQSLSILILIVMCMVVRMTKITGSSSGDWTY
jgi:hypothetical protein